MNAGVRRPARIWLLLIRQFPAKPAYYSVKIEEIQK